MKRKFIKEELEICYEREEGRCALCPSCDLDIPHHVYYGGESKKNDNTHKTMCCLCKKCHHHLHFQKGGSVLRQKCKDYLNNLYDKNKPN